MSSTTTDPPHAALERRPAQRLLDAVSAVAPGLRPATQRLFIRGGYAVVNRWLNDIDAACMNYGYAPLDQDGGGPATATADQEPFSHALYEHVAGTWPLAGREVLEVGCGRGGGAAFVAARFDVARLTGLDFSEKSIDFCRAQHRDQRLRFIVGDAEQLPFSAGFFDAVLNVESSHCYPSVPRFIAEAFRVLRPGGALLFADLRMVDQIDDLRREFRDAGFAVAQEERITANVVRALELDTPRRAELVRRRVPRPLQSYVLNFFATRGSDVHLALRDGDLEYVRFALTKPSS